MTLYKTWLTTIGSIGCIFSRVLPPFQAGSHRCAELATATRCPRGSSARPGTDSANKAMSTSHTLGEQAAYQDLVVAILDE